MRITNETQWNTAHLRAIFQRAAEMELEPLQRKTLIVRVVYAHRGSVSGCAVLGGRHCTLRVGSTPFSERDTPAYWVMELHRALESGVTWCSPEYPASCARQAVHLTEHPPDTDHFKAQIAALAAHEFAHIRGQHHRYMAGYLRWVAGWEAKFQWARALPLEQRAVKPALAQDARVERRLVHIQAKGREAATRLKRAKTLFQKWQRRERRIMKTLAASQSPKHS